MSAMDTSEHSQVEIIDGNKYPLISVNYKNLIENDNPPTYTQSQKQLY